MQKKPLCMLLSLIILFSSAKLSAFADGPYKLPVQVEQGKISYVRAMDGSYLGNIFLSLTDLSAALSGTEKQFRFERIISSTDGEYFTVSRNQASVLPSESESSPDQPRVSTLNPYRNRLLVDGSERRYYTHNPQTGDLYMSLTDIQLMLDFTAKRDASGLVLKLSEPFVPDINLLSQAGYFTMMDSVVIGDSDTGELLFTYNQNAAVPVASLSKLLSYLIIMESVDQGNVSLTDMVKISDAAEAISLSGDGMIVLHAGTSAPFSELMEGMLIASSNECAVALAEHVCGSEAEFTMRMNNRARELGFSSAQMYNCSGLPSYSEESIPIKRQNTMSAFHLFQLAGIILRDYPEIQTITSKQLSHMPSLNDYWTANSNPLVFNMEGVTGLKTGSTNRAGYCLVATMPAEIKGESHMIVLVLLGAETAEIRGQAAEILLRYAQNSLRNK